MVTDPPDEFFDVLTQEGAPTGVAKRRADVHRDGDWHRAFHCWLVWYSADHRPMVLFQRRGPGKDTFPNRLDVAVGGHYRAGETLRDVVREVEEELGIRADLGDLIPIGTRRADRVGKGWIDREIQDVYVYPLPAPATLRPNGDELTALYEVAVGDAQRLFRSERPSVPAYRREIGPGWRLGPAQATDITVDEFIRVEDDYWMAGASAAARVLAGERDVRLVVKA